MKILLLFLNVDLAENSFLEWSALYRERREVSAVSPEVYAIMVTYNRTYRDNANVCGLGVCYILFMYSYLFRSNEFRVCYTIEVVDRLYTLDQLT